MLPLLAEILLPKSTEPGSFGFVRKHDIHTGVDLYCDYKTPVIAMEDGKLVRVGRFTGPLANSPWWHDTDFISIVGKSGCILYGEIQICPHLSHSPEGTFIKKGDLLGHVIPVLKTDKGRPMNMLHLELYDADYTGEGEIWNLNEPQPKQLKNVTLLLKTEILQHQLKGF